MLLTQSAFFSPFLNYAQAGRYLNVSLRTVFRLVAQGKLVPRIHGGVKVFHRDDLDAFSDAQILHAAPRFQRKYRSAKGQVQTLRSLTTDQTPVPLSLPNQKGQK